MGNQFGAKAMMRSALLMTGSTYVAYAAGLITSMLIARGLGPADYGRYAYLIWLSGVLVLLMNHGLTTSAIRFISESLGRQDSHGARSLHRWFQTRQGWSVVVVGSLFLLALPLLKPSGWEGDLLIFAVVALFASVAKAWYLFSISVAKGYGHFGVEASSVSVLSLVNLVGAAVLALMGMHLIAYMLLFLAVSVAHPAMSTRQLHRVDIRKGGNDCDSTLLERVKPHLFWTMVTTLVYAISNKSVETYLLNHLAGAEAVGFFTIAATLTRGGVELLSTGLTTVLMPMMANAFGAGGRDRVDRIAGDAVRYFHFLGLLLTGVGFFWAAPVISMTYGEKYAPAAFALQMMVIIRGMTLSHAALGALLSITDNQRLRAGEALFAIVVSAAMALWLVPRYGLSGAIAAHMISTAAVFLFVVVCVRVVLKVALPWGDLARVTAAGLCAAALSLGALVTTDNPSSLHQILVGILYILTYMAGTLVFKVWNQYDLAMLGNLGNRIPALKRLAFLLAPWARHV
jgi:O-antigen/teichoic acid export membrane protein